MRSRDDIIRDDVRDLERLGYAQQLYREMGGFSNFAVSFSIISILTGAVLLFGYGLKFGGPLVNTAGWPLVSLMTLAVAASMAEIASAYPTAGGLYFWAFRLGGRRWAWITAWLDMIGQVAITAGINVAAAIYIIGIFTREATSWNFQLFVMVLILIPQVAINLWGIRLTARLSSISVWWHIGGVLLIVALLAFAGTHHNSLAFLFSMNPDAQPPELVLAVGEAKMPSLLPWLATLYASAPPLLFFVLALLQAQWTYTGYDASAHMAEETVMARLNSAWGIVLSVGVSAVAGYAMLMALTWSIPNGDIAATANDPYPVLYIVSSNLAPFFANMIAIVIGVAMWLCGVASVTSMGRMWYAFARDDGIPGSRWMKRVGDVDQHDLSLPRVWDSHLAQPPESDPVGGRAPRPPAAGVSPDALHDQEIAPWSLGRWSAALNAIAITWIAFITIVFMLPPNELVLWTMVAVGILLTLYWQGSAKRRFVGPLATTSASATAETATPVSPKESDECDLHGGG